MHPRKLGRTEAKAKVLGVLILWAIVGCVGYAVGYALAWVVFTVGRLLS